MSVQINKVKLKVLVLFDSAGTPPADQDYTEEFKTADWKAERDVTRALKKLGHTVSHLGVYDDFQILVDEIRREKPDIVFNQAEQFLGESAFDRHLVELLELMKVPYTGSPPAGLLLCKNKGLAKKILAYHGIRTPAFYVIHRDDNLTLPKKLNYPLIVKPLREEASYGISQNSLVTNEGNLSKRIQFVTESMGQDVIIEEFVEGREIYVSLLGNRKPTVFPPREMVFGRIIDAEQRFATFKSKWDKSYRKKWGVTNRFPQDFPETLSTEIEQIARKAYEILYLRGYARLDLRVTKEGKVDVIEANPNPHIAKGEDFALSAEKGGYAYLDLIQAILDLGRKQ